MDGRSGTFLAPKEVPLKTNPDRRKRPPPRPLLIALLPFLGAVAAGAQTGEDGAVPAERPVKELLRSAELVFRGTVVEAGAANLSIVEPGPRTAVVRVDEVLKSSGTLDDVTGRLITVSSLEPLGAGEERTFFTSVRLLGESLGVEEVGRPSVPEATIEIELRRARHALLREELATRLSAADLVVAGRVLSTRPTYAVPEDGPFTEHDPRWWQAVVEVRSVLKGGATKTVSFLYPSSTDVMWVRAPKASVGQEGTWLLHRYTPEGGVAAYFIVDPQDLLTAAETRFAESLVSP